MQRSKFIKGCVAVGCLPFVLKVKATQACMKYTSMKRNVAILIFDDAEVLDFAGPFEVFSVTSQLNNYEPFHVFTVAKTNGVVKAVNGLSVNPEYSFNDHPHIEILIIAGGQGTRQLLNDDATLQWIGKIHSKTEITASICSGARLLAKLGLLDEKKYCTHAGVYNHIQELAPSARPQKKLRYIQTAERLYTSGGISAGIDLSFHIVGKLLGKETAGNTAEYMEYNVNTETIQ